MSNILVFKWKDSPNSGKKEFILTKFGHIWTLDSDFDSLVAF
jgi:hypothetical protein